MKLLKRYIHTHILKNFWNLKRKILDHNHDKCKEFSKLTPDNFATRLVKVNLATKADIDFVEKTDFDNEL